MMKSLRPSFSTWSKSSRALCFSTTSGSADLLFALRIAQFVAVCASCGGRSFGHGLNHERRLHVGFNLLVLRHHLTVLGRRRQLPIQHVLGALGVDEHRL